MRPRTPSPGRRLMLRSRATLRPAVFVGAFVSSVFTFFLIWTLHDVNFPVFEPPPALEALPEPLPTLEVLPEPLPALEILSELSVPPATLGPDEPKYFVEPGVGRMGHYDSRFFHGILSDADRLESLRHLIQSYLSTMDRLEITTWLAHGSLLGWYWNEQVLPWDTDLDVQVWASSLPMLAAQHNMSTFPYAADGDSPDREYLLDVNPNYVLRSCGNWMNMIDARWIDKATGLFVDITSLAPPTYNLGVDRLVDKCGHHRYRSTQIEPFIATSFEGVPALVPHDYSTILADEYEPRALTNTHFAMHTWDPESKTWVKDSFRRPLAAVEV